MRWPQAQALSNAAWALATLGHVPPGGLLSQLAERAAAIIRTFRPQATSNTMCASSPLSPAARHCVPPRSSVAMVSFLSPRRRVVHTTCRDLSGAEGCEPGPGRATSARKQRQQVAPLQSVLLAVGLS